MVLLEDGYEDSLIALLYSTYRNQDRQNFSRNHGKWFTNPNWTRNWVGKRNIGQTAEARFTSYNDILRS